MRCRSPSRTPAVGVLAPQRSHRAVTMLRFLHASARAFTPSLRYETRRPVPGPPRQGPRRLRRRRRADPRRHRSHLGVRLRARLGHSRQGPRAQPAVGVLVRPHRRHRPEPSDLDRRRRRIPTARAPYAAAAARADRCWSRRTTPLPVECVARGYLSGSGWKDYKATGEVCGIALPKGLRESDRLPEPIFTPATKADSRPRREHQRSRGRRRSSAPSCWRASRR